MGAVQNHEITSLEGFRDSKRFACLSDAYASLSAVQCGFCTPGMVMASEALLRANPHPSDEQIRDGLSGNLCRCTGYNAIVNAVSTAAEEGSGLW